MTNPDPSRQEQIDADVDASLADMSTIAVIGLSPKPERDSHRVSAYMQQHGLSDYPDQSRSGRDRDPG